MDITIKDLITPIIMMCGIAFTAIIAVSKMTKEQESKFNSMTAKLIEFIVFWFVIGWSIFQIASEVVLSEPISRWVILKIVLYASFIIFMVVLRLYDIFISHVNHLNSTNKAQNELFKEQLMLIEDSQKLCEQSLNLNKEHMKTTKILTDTVSKKIKYDQDVNKLNSDDHKSQT